VTPGDTIFTQFFLMQLTYRKLGKNAVTCCHHPQTGSGSNMSPLLEELMNTEQNETQWGSRLVKMTIFFDNVFQIPPSNRRGKFCIACRQRATFVQLDNDGEPVAYLCEEHVVEARR
jgi:hypothetical protein